MKKRRQTDNAEKHRKPNRILVDRPMRIRHANVNGSTVITLDNRGTGLSDKPVEGYAIANIPTT